MDRKKVDMVKKAAFSFQRFQWEQGCLAQALLELGDLEEAELLARAAAYRCGDDGRIGIMDTNFAVDDPAASGEAILYFGQKKGDIWLKETADKLMKYLNCNAPKTPDGILYHFTTFPQVWCDSYYMGPPFMAAYGEYDEAIKQIKGLRKYLFHEKTGLHSHAWDEVQKRFTRPYHWGVGNGWAMSGVTRVIHLLPQTREEDRLYLIEFLKKMLDGCLVYQRTDGYFHDELDNDKSFIDTNTGQMVAYTIYRGVQRGYLEENYLSYADKSRKAAHNKVDPYGFVKDVCGLPEFDRPYVATEGQVFFLLMEAAATELYGTEA